MSAITHLIAGVSVSDLDASLDWYTRFFGPRPGPSRRITFAELPDAASA